MKIMPFFVLAGLLLLMPIDYAHAATIFSGETFATTGIITQTSGSNCCGTLAFTGSMTLGSMVPSTTDWTLIAFNTDAVPAGSVWTFSSLEFDASTSTLFGTASAPHIGSGGDSRLLTLTFIDGNTSTDPWTDADLTNPDNGRAGTFSYSAAPVPEPSSGVLVLSVLGLAGLAAAWRNVLI